MLENEIRHAAICEEINRAYKQGLGRSFMRLSTASGIGMTP